MSRVTDDAACGFPYNSIVSLLYVMEDGELSEIAVSAKKGLVGAVSLFLWAAKALCSRAVVYKRRRLGLQSGCQSQ